MPDEISCSRRVPRTISKINLDQRNTLVQGEVDDYENEEDEEMSDSKRKMRGLKRLS